METYEQRLERTAKERLNAMSPSEIHALAETRRHSLRKKRIGFGILWISLFCIFLLLSIVGWAGGFADDTTSAYQSQTQTICIEENRQASPVTYNNPSKNAYVDMYDDFYKDAYNYYDDNYYYDDDDSYEPTTYSDSVGMGVVYCFFSLVFATFMILHFALIHKHISKSDAEIALILIKNQIARDVKLAMEKEADQNAVPYPNFIITKTIKLWTKAPIEQKLFLDEPKKKFTIKIGDKFYPLYNYTDVIRYEVYENGNTVLEGRTGRAIAGGLIGGAAGAIIANSGSREVKGTCSDLQLIIHLNDPNCTHVVLNYVQRKEIDKDSSDYRRIREDLQTICAQLEFMMNQKNMQESQKIHNYWEQSISLQESNLQAKQASATTSASAPAPTDKRAQLSELKSLLDDGFITQEEYDQKRKQILGL